MSEAEVDFCELMGFVGFLVECTWDVAFPALPEIDFKQVDEDYKDYWGGEN